MLLWAHPSPNPKWHLDLFSRFCIAHLRAPRTVQWAALYPQNCPFPWEIWTPSNTWFLGPIQVLTQTASRSVQPFCRAHYCDRPTDRPTDRPRYSVGNNRLHLRTYLFIYLLPRCGLLIPRHCLWCCHCGKAPARVHRHFDKCALSACRPPTLRSRRPTSTVSPPTKAAIARRH